MDVRYNYDIISDLYLNNFQSHPFLNHKYLKKNVKKRKVLLNVRKGLTKTEPKNSLKRDINNTILQQYINLMITDGNKFTVFKNLDKMVESFFFILNEEDDEFSKYKHYEPLSFLVNFFVEYNDFNYLLELLLPKYCSIFEMKTKKINKKKRIATTKKYSHEVVYVTEPKRLKNLLKNINIYSESFKKYELWERMFWLFIIVLLEDEGKKSYFIERRSYIYKKSLKFFMKKKDK